MGVRREASGLGTVPRPPSPDRPPFPGRPFLPAAHAWPGRSRPPRPVRSQSPSPWSPSSCTHRRKPLPQPPERPTWAGSRGPGRVRVGRTGPERTGRTGLGMARGGVGGGGSWEVWDQRKAWHRCRRTWEEDPLCQSPGPWPVEEGLVAPTPLSPLVGTTAPSVFPSRHQPPR